MDTRIYLLKVGPVNLLERVNPMLAQVIKFDITDVKAQISNSYMVPNTPKYCDKVLQHRFTRNIEFTTEFAIDSPSYKFPVAFLNCTIEDDIDPIDQMH